MMRSKWNDGMVERGVVKKVSGVGFQVARSRKFYLTGANRGNGEWKNGTLE